jgi:shikimate kinase
LTSSLEKIIQRISRDSSRPPLEGNLSFREEQQKVLIERDPKYRAAADCIFETTHLEPRQTALKIITRFKKERWI